MYFKGSPLPTSVISNRSHRIVGHTHIIHGTLFCHFCAHNKVLCFWDCVDCLCDREASKWCHAHYVETIPLPVGIYGACLGQCWCRHGITHTEDGNVIRILERLTAIEGRSFREVTPGTWALGVTDTAAGHLQSSFAYGFNVIFGRLQPQKWLNKVPSFISV